MNDDGEVNVEEKLHEENHVEEKCHEEFRKLFFELFANFGIRRGILNFELTKFVQKSKNKSI